MMGMTGDHSSQAISYGWDSFSVLSTDAARTVRVTRRGSWEYRLAISALRVMPSLLSGVLSHSWISCALCDCKKGMTLSKAIKDAKLSVDATPSANSEVCQL